MSAHASPPSPSRRPRPLVLCILDGLGERAEPEANAVVLARTPNLRALARSYPRTVLAASGPDVGLPPGHAGSSEAGHLSLGAGRIPRTDFARVDQAIAEARFGSNEVIDQTFRIIQEYTKGRLHVFCLVSGARVHASVDHLHALIEIARFHEIRIVLHAFLDGRDAHPRSAWVHIEPLQDALQGVGTLGTLSGRQFAMDRDGRWDRVFKAYTAIVRGDAPRAETAFEALQRAYEAGATDDRVEPIRIGDYEGVAGSFMADFASKTAPVWEWYGEEVGLAMNVRADRMRQLSAMLMRRGLPPEVEGWLTDRGKAVYAFQEHCYRCLTEHDPALKLPVAFPREQVRGSFGEVLAAAGLRQLRCAETEKGAHVTTFFSGGREEPFPGEDRRLVPSPRDAASHQHRPEMSAAEVAEEAVAAIRSGGYDFILVNFANPDVLGHTGDLGAVIRGLEAADAGVGAIVEALREAGGALLVTSAHGNCEQMQDAAGQSHAGHTTHPVPLYYMNDADPGIALRPGGRIADIAPTMLEILGLPQPEEMTGRSLRVST